MATNGGPTSYRIRKIKFRGRTVPILMQNENGPCPLLAISNILLLQGQLQIHPDYSEYRGEQLLQLVAERVLATSSSVRDDRRTPYSRPMCRIVSHSQDTAGHGYLPMVSPHG